MFSRTTVPSTFGVSPMSLLMIARSMAPSALLPDGLALDLFFDREKLYLSRVAVDLSGSQLGDLTAALAFTKFDEAVTIEAPPSDEVTEGSGGLPFP